MFVYSIKSKHIKVALLAIFVVLTAVSLFILSQDSKETGKSGMSIKAATHDERMAFLSQYGWEIDEEPVEVQEVIIPSEFDDTYNAYNEIQKDQGFDLTVYAGMRAKRWTYIIKNYSGYENKDCIRVNVLVYDGLVIGGDVCSIELDGFMHGFQKP
ncbi:MAG: DUF4830 domain-containing protein [Clostridia bacterium]|nr:DUF4830 domain-containing protein [Clostridia bacterium]